MYLSSLWASLISTVWAAEHDYGHLCNSFVVDLYYELIHVWDCNGSVSVMKVDAYYVPRSYLLVMIKHVYESMWGGTCALVGVTGGGSCSERERKFCDPLGCFTLLCSLTRDKEKYHATEGVGVTIATSPWLDLACSYFNFMSLNLLLCSDLS